VLSVLMCVVISSWDSYTAAPKTGAIIRRDEGKDSIGLGPPLRDVPNLIIRRHG
jgi:hypothetical protein